MKKTTFLLGALLALAACKKDTSTAQDPSEAQLEEAAADVSLSDGPASPDGATPGPTSLEPLPEEPLPGVPSTASSAPSDANPLFNLTLQKGQAGAVRIGMPIAELKEAYGQNKLEETSLTLEGMTTTAFHVLGERRRPDLRVEQECAGQACKVSRITVLNPAFKSRGGVGIGSPFSAVKSEFNISRVGLGEGNFVAISEDARMSFVLDMSGIPAERLTKLQVKDIPASTLVSGVLIY